MTKKTRAKVRRALLTLSLVLVVAFAAVGGTLAWLQDSTDAVTNTFKATNLDIELTETLDPEGNQLSDGETWEADILPGASYRKNPTVTVSDDSEDCWLFVKVTLSEGLSNYFEYELNLDSWTPVETTNTDTSTTTVYGISATAGQEFELLNKVDGTDYEIVVPEILTKDQMPSGDVTMVFDACAIQKAELTHNGTAIGETDVQAAWNYVKTLNLM